MFNGDNKQTEVKDRNNYPVGRYFYDGEGKRVKKISDAETTIFVYSVGKMVAEYSTVTPPANPTTSYTMTDMLGSPRVITDAQGQIKSRRDFMPFGEEVNFDTSNRTIALKYGTNDGIRQKFTGYQNDTETGLDFAEARMYETRTGRFTAVDPLVASATIRDPQTFNRYTYALNSPYKFTDPLGLVAMGAGAGAAYGSDVDQTFRNRETYGSLNVDFAGGGCWMSSAACVLPSIGEVHGISPAPPPIDQNSEPVPEAGQNGTAVPDPTDPPIIILDKATIVSLSGNDEKSLVTKSDFYDYKDKPTEAFSTAYDAAVDAREIDQKYADNMYLRVDLSIIGKGSFLNESDKSGVDSVTVGSSLARNISVAQSTKDSLNPIVSAAASSVTVYTKLTIKDLKQTGSIIVTLKATANYREGPIDAKGNLQLGNERNRTITYPFRIKVVH